MATRNGHDPSVSYRQWADSNPRPLTIEALEVDDGGPVVRRPGRPARGRRGPIAPRLVVHDSQAEAFDEPEYNVDEQLERLTRKVIMRLHQEISNYSVPQLLSGLHKCLQVRVLLQTLRLKGGGDTNVGSAARRYSTAFQTDDAGNGTRNSRQRTPAPDADDILDYLTDED